MTSTEMMTEILADPCASYWLKDAIRSALGRDCLDVMYDAQLLARVLRKRVEETGMGAVLRHAS